jgi:hypothetical protein
LNDEMQRLLAEAQVLAGGQHQCVVLGHKWESRGGRICPRGDDMGGGPCSQTVYVCGSCGLEDYGQPGGPAHDDCYKFGPCDRNCIQTSSHQEVKK